MALAIGIDLGTTNSAVAVMEAGDAKVIPSTEGTNLTPSVVAFKDGERLVGVTARRQAVLNPTGTIFSIKRLVGRRYAETDREQKMLSYKIAAGRNDTATVEIDGQSYTTEEISSMIIQKLKGDAEAYLGEEIKQAVITVPAYFDNSQRTATKNAGEIAGIDVMRIINEPTAAALAYGLDKNKEGLILVWDLGGGTFDVSILDISGGVFEVKATKGDTHLGGDDWDQRIIEHCIEEFRRTEDCNLREDAEAMQRVREAAEKAKMELSTMMEVEINLPYIAPGPKHLSVRLTRATFEEMTRDLVQRCETPFREALSDAELTMDQIEEVILVGGSTRMPMIQKLIHDLTGKEPHKGVNPDEVVALGAAIQAAVLTGNADGLVLLDVTPLSLGVETLGDVRTVMIPRNTTIPTRKAEMYTTAADGQSEVTVHVLQGERQMAPDNKSLGKFNLVGIPPGPRGMPQIEVTFDIDANGILNVKAEDKATKKEQSIIITDSSSLTSDEKDQMIQDAENFAEQDTARHDMVDARNKGDQAIYQAEQMLREHGEKVSGADRGNIESAINDLKEAIKGEDADHMNRATEQLAQDVGKLSQTLYEQAAAESEQPAEESSAPEAETSGDNPNDEDDKVIDADYKESE